MWLMDAESTPSEPEDHHKTNQRMFLLDEVSLTSTGSPNQRIITRPTRGCSCLAKPSQLFTRTRGSSQDQPEDVLAWVKLKYYKPPKKKRIFNLKPIFG